MNRKRIGVSHVMALCAIASIIAFAVPASETMAQQATARKEAAARCMGDIELAPGGTLNGTMVDSNGAPVSGSEVSIRRGGRTIAAAKTNPQGRFQLRDLRGGVYEIHTADGGGLVRAWTPKTAPPTARRGIVLVAKRHVVRGQQPDPSGALSTTSYRSSVYGSQPGAAYGPMPPDQTTPPLTGEGPSTSRYTPPAGAYTPPAGTYTPSAGTYTPSAGQYAPPTDGGWAPPPGTGPQSSVPYTASREPYSPGMGNADSLSQPSEGFGGYNAGPTVLNPSAGAAPSGPGNAGSAGGAYGYAPHGTDAASPGLYGHSAQYSSLQTPMNQPADPGSGPVPTYEYPPMVDETPVGDVGFMHGKGPLVLDLVNLGLGITGVTLGTIALTDDDDAS